MSEIEQIAPIKGKSDIASLLGDDPDLLGYSDLFIKHSIKADVFSDLTADDLADIGVSVMGHRIKIMRLVKAFNQKIAQSQSPSSSHAAVSGNNGASSSAIIDDDDNNETETINALASQCEGFETQIKKLGDQIVRLRSDIARFNREADHPPSSLMRSSSLSTSNLNPSNNNNNTSSSSTATTPLSSASSSSASSSRKPSQDGYFVSRVGSGSGSETPISPSSTVSTLTMRNAPSAASRVPADMARINIAAANNSQYPQSSASPGTATRYKPMSATSGSPPSGSFSPPSGSIDSISAPVSGMPNYKHRLSHIELPHQPLRTSSAPQVPTTHLKSPMTGVPGSSSAAHYSSPYGVIPDQLKKGSGSRINLSSGMDPLQSLKCNEEDNTVEVLMSMIRNYNLDGDVSQWRLQINSNGIVRDLLDHEHPLRIYKQFKDSGNREGVAFHARRVKPTRPPADGFL